MKRIYTKSSDLIRVSHLTRFRMALTLARAFRDDPYSAHFFRANLLGIAARFLVFADEISSRRASGVILSEAGAVALVGLPPTPFLSLRDIGFATRLALDIQGSAYRAKWSTIWRDLSASQPANVVYLSALACPKRERRRGHGSRLLARARSLADDLGLPLTFDVSTLQLVDWYRRRGFSVVGTHAFVGGPTIYHMSTTDGPTGRH
jgi:GNAT superfamily N-acetyltransferase